MMNKKIINNTLIALFFTLTVFTNAMSQSVNSSFTYQGELLDNGVPASGQYDINIDLIDGDLVPWGDTSVHSPVDVVNGLFSVNAYFGIDSFDGFKDVTVTVSVRKTSEGPGGAFTTLGSQTIQAVPLATNLTNGNATSGQVLTFNGFQWVSADSANPWENSNSNIYYEAGDVGIGDSSPLAKLHVQSVNDTQDPFRVRVGTNSKFWVKGDGSSNFFGDTKQGLSNNGMMKFMVHVDCDAAPNIVKSYNGVANSGGAISIDIGSGAGSCEITFPSSIVDRYWQVSPVYASSTAIPGLRGATCRMGGNNNILRCERFNIGTASLSSGEIMVLIY